MPIQVAISLSLGCLSLLMWFGVIVVPSIRAHRIAKKERSQLAAEKREVPGDYLSEAIAERWWEACLTDPVQQWLLAADERTGQEECRRNIVILNNSRLASLPVPQPAVGQLWIAPFNQSEVDQLGASRTWSPQHFGKEVIIKQADSFIFYRYICDGFKAGVLKRTAEDFTKHFKFISHGAQARLSGLNT